MDVEPGKGSLIHGGPSSVVGELLLVKDTLYSSKLLVIGNENLSGSDTTLGHVLNVDRNNYFSSTKLNFNIGNMNCCTVSCESSYACYACNHKDNKNSGKELLHWFFLLLNFDLCMLS